MILFINACVRENSRTERLARAVLSTLGACEERKLDSEELNPLSRELLEYRSRLIDEGNYSDPIFDRAKQFASADTVVIAAPYWDGSFPAALKVYLENIYITGIVSRYGEDGRPQGLCRAKKLWYVTTAGGPYDGSFSYDYVKALAQNMFGIPETELVKAENLDIFGNDPEAILREAMRPYLV